MRARKDEFWTLAIIYIVSYCKNIVGYIIYSNPFELQKTWQLSSTPFLKCPLVESEPERTGCLQGST